MLYFLAKTLWMVQGLIHYIWNNNSCSQAQVITAYDNKDPGTISSKFTDLCS